MAFDYLVEPRNRPEWQSSLRRVELLDQGEPRVGLHWVDVTWLGIRPQMQLVQVARPASWAESGGWRGVAAAHLSLGFRPTDRGCAVSADFRVGLSGRGGRWMGRPLRAAGRVAVRADLRRAARILSARAAEH